MTQKQKNALSTTAIIVLAVAGFLYFGLSAIIDNNNKNQTNPFEYNVDHFKKGDSTKAGYVQTATYSVSGESLSAIAVDSQDRIFVASDQSVIILDKTETIAKTIDLNQQAYCLAFDKDDNLYIGYENFVEILNASGSKIAQFESFENGLFTSIAVYENDIYVADAGNHVVWRFDKAGKLLARIGEENKAKDIPGFVLPSAYFDVAVDPDGFLWAVNPGMHSLENYTPNGDLRSSWTKASMHIEGFCGCCNPSHIAILKDGSFVTSEKGLPRVKIYNVVGELTAIVALPDQFDEGTVDMDLTVDSQERIVVLDPKRKMVRVFEPSLEN